MLPLVNAVMWLSERSLKAYRTIPYLGDLCTRHGQATAETPEMSALPGHGTRKALTKDLKVRLESLTNDFEYL